MYLKEKKEVLIKKRNEIVVPCIFIKTSISLLVIKIFLAQLLFGLILFAYLVIDFILSHIYELEGHWIANSIIVFTIILMQMAMVFIVIAQWIFESYKVTPTEITHKKGVLFEKLEHYTYRHVMSVDIQQTFWGKLLNFGTIHMYDRYINSEVYLYHIHNPIRYFDILSSLIPYIDKNEEIIENPYQTNFLRS